MFLFDENPNVIFNNIKELLIIGAKDRNHAFHTPVFSNNNNQLHSSRVVVLRKFIQENMSLIFNTDYRSPKILELKKSNQSNFLFYDTKLKIQLRIATISNIHYDDKTALEAWGETRLFSRKCYLAQEAPSSLTNKPSDGIPNHLKGIDPNKTESEKGYINFCVIENIIHSIDWLYLASSGHRRLKINLKNNKPTFNWMIP